MLKKLRRKVYRKIRFQTWYRKAYYYHRKRRDLDKTIAQYRGVDVLSDKKRLYRLRRDMIRSLFRYGSYYNEYFLFGYEGKDADYRDSFITEGVRMSYYPRMNDPKNTNLLENKYLTYQKFRDFYGRDVLRIKKGAQPTPAALEALRDFTQAHPDYIVKPIYAAFGKGVHTESIRDYPYLEAAHAAYSAHGAILEQIIEQGKALSASTRSRSTRCASRQSFWQMAACGSSTRRCASDAATASSTISAPAASAHSSTPRPGASAPTARTKRAAATRPIRTPACALTATASRNGTKPLPWSQRRRTWCPEITIAAGTLPTAHTAGAWSRPTAPRRWAACRSSHKPAERQSWKRSSRRCDATAVNKQRKPTRTTSKGEKTMTELEKLVEKDAIRDQYYVYARALDRIDNPLGKTVFAEDAQVDYGPTYKGTGYGFIDMMLKMHRKMVSTHHVMTNILIKLNEDGTKAAAEAYMYAACKYRNGMVVVARCRDIDLWEKRDGKWLVVKRTVAGDNTMILHPDFAPDYNNGRDKVKDPSYDYFETIE